MPVITVAIPTYNRSSLVRQAVESVLAQTFTDLDIVVIDDGSTDDTRSVIEAFVDRRVRYHYKENGGCASARNAGIQQARGEYFAYLDSDDLWPENFLDEMLKQLKDNPQYSCVYCPIEKVFPDGSRKGSYDARQCRSGWITRDLFKTSFIWIQAAVFRTEALKSFVFDDSMRNGADTDALLRLSTRIEFLYYDGIKVLFRADHGVAPRKDISSLNCNRILLLERFYYRLGGDKYISASEARQKLSHAYRSNAKTYYKMNCRKGAIGLYKRAIKYWPLDVRLYPALVSSLLLDGKKDPCPEWVMPSGLRDIEL